jgi:hypothetical protein
LVTNFGYPKCLADNLENLKGKLDFGKYNVWHIAKGLLLEVKEDLIISALNGFEMVS